MFSQELRDHVISYLDNKISLQDLEDWIVPNAPELIHNPNDADLIAEIELQLAEFSDNLRDEEQIRQSLRIAISSTHFWVPEKPGIYSQTTSSSSIVDRYLVTVAINQPIRQENLIL